MAILQSNQTNFTAGEIDPRLLGRGDLRAYQNGAAKLRNVFIHPAGGVIRRAGLRYVDTARGSGRLVSFEFNTEQVYLLVFSDRYVDVYRDGVRVAGFDAPWTKEQLSQIDWTQSADTLLIVHPDVPPKKITRTSDTAWDIADWQFLVKSDGRISSPHVKFGDPSVKLQANDTTGTVSVTASAPVFLSSHVGARIRIADRELNITSVNSSTLVHADVIQSLSSTKATTDWTEEAFSTARGWPTSVCFHQDRMVIGGSRDLPNYLWLSQSDDLFNFELGQGLDDEAISFPILSDQVNAIRQVFSGRDLQVFTSGAEWMVSGDPLTPTNIQLDRQTRVGSSLDRSIPPRDVDGATMFVPRTDGQLREFLFTNTEQAYQSADLAMLAPHLLQQAIDMDYDASARLLHVVLANGNLATLTAYRDEQVSAWTLQQTDGSFEAIATVGDETCFLVQRRGGVFIEVFDTELNVDAGLIGTVDQPTNAWSGADHLNGETVKVVADGIPLADSVVEGGSITLDGPSASVQMGLPFTHIIEPLPVFFSTLGGGAGGRLRPINFSFRFWNTAGLRLDRGEGLKDVSFKRFGETQLDEPPPLFCGDLSVRAAGWRQDLISPLWRIEQDIALPFTLLSVSTTVSLNK